MELIDLTRFFAALIFILALMGGLALILRYIDQNYAGSFQKFIHSKLTHPKFFGGKMGKMDGQEAKASHARSGSLKSGALKSGRRMQILEKTMIDRQKTALILRIDEVEYLVISSASGDTVIEKLSNGHQPMS